MADHAAVTKLCKDRTSQLNATRRELSTLAPMPRHGGSGAVDGAAPRQPRRAEVSASKTGPRTQHAQMLI